MALWVALHGSHPHMHYIRCQISILIMIQTSQTADMLKQMPHKE